MGWHHPECWTQNIMVDTNTVRTPQILHHILNSSGFLGLADPSPLKYEILTPESGAVKGSCPGRTLTSTNIATFNPKP